VCEISSLLTVKSGDFFLVVAVKKEKTRAQALAGGRKGTGKG
jgi:hypothetical protein